MDWQINAPEFDIGAFGGVAPDEVLYEFDGPRIFTANSSFGTLLYFLAEEDDGVSRFIAAPTNPQVIERLKNGISSVRDALNQPWIWVLDISFDGTPQKSWRCTLADVPADALPKPGRAIATPTYADAIRARGINEN